jgi:YaiO family outer membrane protein
MDLHRIGLLTCLFALCICSGFAQTVANSDSLFVQAKQYAKNNDYTKAQATCSLILNTKEDGDVRFYLGLLYSWDSKYDEARKEFEKVRESRPTSEEVIVAQTNNELWAENPENALTIINKALLENPRNEEFLYLKAKALYKLKRYDEALAVLNQLLAINPANEKAKSLLDTVKIAGAKNALMLDYVNEFSDNQPTRYLTYLQYSRKTSIVTIIGRLNYASWYSSNDFQLESDAYLNTGKRNYLYLNVGYSGAKLFPEYRFGAELFQSLPKSFEASLGFRYLMFSSSGVNIYTGSVGKYWGNYWFCFRPFITPSGNRVSYTGVFQVRRYFDDAEKYFGVQYSHGSSPDDIHIFLENADKLRLQSDKVKLTFNHRLAIFWVAAISGAFEREEYYPTLFHNKYTIDLSLQRIF